MKRWIAAAALALPLFVAGCSHPQPVYYAGPPPPPPPAYAEAGQQGYRQGFDAGVRDARRGIRRPAERHQLFRNPPVPPPVMGEYRRGFVEGYRRAFQPPPPPQ